MLIVGEIIKAQGIKGELKVRPITNDISRFKKLRAAYIGTALYQIVGQRVYDGFVFIRLSGVDDRDKAESLVGKFLEIDRIHAVTTEDDEYFIVELIGCDFYIDGDKRGVIKNILQTGAADIFEVLLDDGKTMLFPFLKRLELEIDPAARKVSANSAALDSVAVID